jgi:nicotinamide-nucleotide amidase
VNFPKNAEQRVAIACFGTELTRGELVNTNAAWLSESLTSAGLRVTECVVVDDDEARMIRTLGRLGSEVDAIVCTGGLGPTTDDMTTAAVANLLGVELVRDAAVLESIRQRFERVGRTMSPSNAKQADFPAGARILPNAEGTAPGFESAIGGARAFFMPGVPREMKAMFRDSVLPQLRRESAITSHQIHLRTFGFPESVVGEKLAGIEAANPGVILGYRAHFPEIEVKVFAASSSQAEAQVLSARVADEVRARLGDCVFGGKEDTFGGAVLRELKTRKLTLAIAESCTGGLTSHLLTREAGASEALIATIVPYANAAKVSILGVSPDTIAAHGAVSAEVACELAEKVRLSLGADIGLGITGIAGPDGGSDAKPVGTVHIATATKSATHHEVRLFAWHRGFVQLIAAYAGLEMVRRTAMGKAPA